MAALLTRWSMPPNRSTAVAAIASTDAGSDTSVRTNTPLMSSATACPRSSTSATTTDAPSAASARAYASPMPCAAPVTIATLPSNLMPRPPCLDSSSRTSCAAVPPVSRALRDRLGLQVLLEPGHAHLAADAGLLVAPERDVRPVPDATVHADGPGAQPPRDGPRPLGVAAVHRARQPVRRVVGDADRVVVAVVRHDHQYRAEDLLTCG